MSYIDAIHSRDEDRIYVVERDANGDPVTRTPDEAFDDAIALKPNSTPEEIASKEYLKGIAAQSGSKGANLPEIVRLFNFLNTMDHRRNTSWAKTFPWLVDEFAKHNLTL
jgi:hypothetical protein